LYDGNDNLLIIEYTFPVIQICALLRGTVVVIRQKGGKQLVFMRKY